MFAQVFESASPNYWTPAQFGIEPPFIYHTYLTTPPRIYAEEIGGLNGVFTRKENTQTSNFTLHVMTTQRVVYYPSYDWRHWWFDGITGELLGRDDAVAVTLFPGMMFQARDGGIWAQVSSGGLGEYVFECDPVSFAEIPGTRQNASKYGGGSLHSPLVDRAENLFIARVTSLIDLNQLGIFDLTTGALIRKMYMPGTVVQVFPEDYRHAYVIHDNDIMTLIDYTRGEIIGVMKAPGVEAGALGALYAWDRYLRRMLRFTHRPDATDGACLSTFRGYYPRLLPVGLTSPIPIRALRAGRDMPFIARTYGDAGESLPGFKITPTTGSSDIHGAPPFTDRDGEALITLHAEAAGSDTLTVSCTA